MKNIITLLLATACSINSLWASIVPMQTAQVVATNFYRQNNIGITSFAVLAYTEKSPSGDALFYVFNMSGNGGFVIVSADNVVEPIIGYSNTGQYIMPEKGTNIDFWMQVKKKEIIGAKVKGIPATKEIASKWSNYKNSTTSIVSRQQHRVNSIFPSNTNYLVQTTWNQEPYYNAMCPGGSVTGCVATAMSQIMRYWQFPATGTSAHCYSSSYGTLCADFDTVQYRWKEMPLSLSASTPSGQSQEVAKLMYDAGVSVDMEYSPSGSGAWVIKGDDDSVCAQIAYYKYFKYDSNSIQGFRASSFSYVEWQTLIENELNNSRPVEYAGWDPLAGGHTWVCDGYNSLNQFHMNWGWGGQDNGWFALNNLDPGGLDFSVGFEAVIGIEPSGSSSCSLVANDKYVSGASGLVSFTSTSTGVSGGTTYTWYLGDGSPPVTGVSSLSYTYKYNGTYYVFLNLNNSSTGCSSWKIDSVKITNATTCSLTAAFNYNMGNNGTASFMNNTSGADAGVTYTWDPGDGSSSVNGSSFTHTYAYNGYYLVTLSAQNSGYGCTSQQAQYVLVNTAPPCNIVPSFKYTSGPGGIINFTSTSTGANPGAIYYWDPGDGSPMVPGKNTFSYKYDYNNTYYAEMYVEDSGYNGCLAYYVDSIKVSNGTSCKLKAKFNYVAGASGKVNFNSTSTGVTPGAEYYWYFGDNTQAETTLNTFTHSYTYDGTYYAELGIMDTGYGCYSYYDTSVTISNAWVCNVRPKITAVTGANGQVNFSSSSSSGVYPGASYYWYFYDGTSGTGSTCSHTFTYNGNYYVDLSISDTGGYCSGQADTDINISNALPCNLVVSFNAAYGANGQVVFTNTSSGVYPGATINWSFGDGTYGTGNTCTHTYTYNGNYYVYLSIADSGYGCTSSFNEMITITNGRECNLHASFNSILGSNGLVNFNNTSTGLYPGASNSWYFGDGNVANTANCTHVYTANGNYYVSLYVSDSGYGCYSSWDTLLSITNANPTNGCNLNVSFSYGRNYGRQISFANSTQGVTAGSTYDWYFGDGSYGAGSHCIHNYSKDGRYLVQLEINSNGCYSIGRDSITVYNDTIVQFQSNTLYTYPNPNNGSFTLYLQNIPLNSYADISVDNVIGQEMYRWGVTINNTGNMYIPMDIPGLQAGIYFIRVTVMGQVYTTKMCVYR